MKPVDYIIGICIIISIALISCQTTKVKMYAWDDSSYYGIPIKYSKENKAFCIGSIPLEISTLMFYVNKREQKAGKVTISGSITKKTSLWSYKKSIANEIILCKRDEDCLYPMDTIGQAIDSFNFTFNKYTKRNIYIVVIPENLNLITTAISVNYLLKFR